MALKKTSLVALLAAGIALPVFAAEQTVNTDEGTLDRQTAEKVFPASTD